MLVRCLGGKFKIHGVMVGNNFKDGLSFISLGWQIELGKKVGYKESDIVEAVIHAVVLKSLSP